MPTVLPRFQVTETPEVAHALEVAAEAWPHLPRAERVKRLLVGAADQLDREMGASRAEHIASIAATAGILREAFAPGYLEQLRDEWPA